MRRRRMGKAEDSSPIIEAPFDNCQPRPLNQYPTPPIPPAVYDAHRPLYEPPFGGYTPAIPHTSAESPAKDYQQIDMSSPPAPQAPPPSYEDVVTLPSVRK
ncbi:hypothetical protein Unana1_07362 [Umbelopsis nana]